MRRSGIWYLVNSLLPGRIVRTLPELYFQLARVVKEIEMPLSARISK